MKPDDLLIIGRSGQLAGALQREAPGATALGRERFDLASGDPGALITRHKPEAVINAAAFTDVNGAEDQAEAARALNRDGPARLAKACADAGAAFVHVSTDYVFDGAGGAPYAEDAPVNPLNVYGLTKLEGERAVLEAHPGAVVVRASWVFDAAGGTFLNAILPRLETGQPLKLVDDQISAPTFADDLADALLTIAQARIEARGAGGTVHYLGGEHASWHDFGRAAAEAARPHLGHEPEITAVGSDAFPQKAPRPRDTRLQGNLIAQRFGVELGDWRSGLHAVLRRRYQNHA